MTTMTPRKNARSKKLISRYNKLQRKHDARMHKCILKLQKRFQHLNSLSSLSLSSLSDMSTWSSDFSFDSWDFSLDLSDDVGGLGQDWLEKAELGSSNKIAGDLGNIQTGLMGSSEDRWTRLQRWVHQQMELANQYEEPRPADSRYVFCDGHAKMRIRIQTIPPLPDLKAWFVPRPTGAILTVKTVSELKKVLCHDITQLSQGGHSFKTIRLLLEGFELLDDLPCEEVLRDGDLVFIQVSQEVPGKSKDVKKRKRGNTLDGVLTKRRRKNNNKSAGCDVAVKTSTSSDSSSVESASTSESDDESENSDSGSSTTSNNESSSESSDGSVASSSTSGNSSRRLSLPLAPIPQPKVPATSPVPPGLGKPSTQSRNRRRRLKRQYVKDAKEAQNAPPQGISDANLTPLGSTVSEKPSKGTKSGNGAEPGTKTSTELAKTQSASDDSSPLALDNSNGDIMMMSMRNKNKKKNFRQTMNAPAVKKIVFDDSGNTQSAGTVPAPASSVVSPLHAERTETVQEDQTADTPTSLPSRVLPPSELAAAGLLPSNMFVTSVEFGKQPKKKKKKQNLRDTHEEEQVSQELRVSRAYEDEDESRFEDADIHLSYGDEEESGNKNDVGESQFDWGIAESNWERFSPVQSLDQLRSGVLVCWQCLAINPRTFTPENMLSVGRVEKVTTEAVIIQQLLRPGTEIAAAFGIGEEDGGDGAEEVYSPESLSRLGWRVVELA